VARTVTRLLKGRDVWKAITMLVKGARRTVAAVAYLGRDGGELLPLKAGDTLVVDMSLGAVRQGVTDPREVEKFMDRKVHVASRADLHAKMVVADGWLITGSMNASRNSADVLAEAAVLTNATGAVAEARKTIEQWARAPVLPLQLEKALKEYRPPSFKPAKAVRRRKRQQPSSVQGPSLWLLCGLKWRDIPEPERETAREHQESAVRGRRRGRGTNRHMIHFGRRTRFIDEARADDWVIEVTEGEVGAPSLIAAKIHYARGNGKRRYLVIVEARDAETSSWTAFKRAAGKAANVQLKSQTTRVFRDPDVVTALLGCWSRKTGAPLKKFFALRRKPS
jgi:hypothetical protein